MFDAELETLLAEGYVLVGRVGYRERFELRARAHGRMERIDHADWVQLVGSRDAREVVVRLEMPGTPSPRVLVLTHDPSAEPKVVVEVGGLYLGGRYRVVERIDDPALADARWTKTELPSCWVSEPSPSCC